MNLDCAARLLQSLARAGVTDWCLCPGGRNAPLVEQLSAAAGGRLYTFFEERSAAFFALGRSRRTGVPAAVITTSGTAAAELLPAAMEACYRGTPLVLVTADRPAELRGTGAPQTVVQPGLFEPYAPTLFDGRGGEGQALAEWDGRGPVHLNPCYPLPLLAGEGAAPDLAARPFNRRWEESDPEPVAAFLARVRRPLVLVGELHREDRGEVAAFLEGYGAPFLAEATAGLEGATALEGLRLRGGAPSLEGLAADGVLRLGGVPHWGLWRQLAEGGDGVPVCSVDRTIWPGLAGGEMVTGRVGRILHRLRPGPVDPEYKKKVLAADGIRSGRLDELCRTLPRSEPALLRALAGLVPAGSHLFLGNSSPVRDWDLAALTRAGSLDTAASRGVNGIDGQLSTWFGWAEREGENWAILGDLTVLYDLAAPWILPLLQAATLRLVLVNNGGGQIFRHLFANPLFRNQHRVDFRPWCAMWGLEHRRWEQVPELLELPPRVVIELCPCGDQTDRFRRSWRHGGD